MKTSPGGRLEFSFGFGQSVGSSGNTHEDQFTVWVLSDFSGRSNRGVKEPLSTRQVLPITIDNREPVFTSLACTLDLDTACHSEPTMRVRLEALEDFHPDRLLKRIEPLAELFQATQELRVPAKAREAAGRLQRWLSARGRPSRAEQETRTETQSAAPGASESADATLRRLLGKTEREVSTANNQGGASPVAHLIRQALESTQAITPIAPAGMEGFQAAAELELSSRLRHILHDSQFQAMEAAWRGVDFLLRRCPDEERVRLAVLDVTLDEIAQDGEGLRRLLQDTPPQLLVGNYTFGRTEADLAVLEKLAKLGAELGTRFVSQAHPLLAGCDGFDRHPDPEDWQQVHAPEVMRCWTALRALPHSRCVGLALPRFLLRQPYGKGSDEIEGFPFEEVAGAAEHEAFPWGNPAFACAQVIAESVVAGTEERADYAGLEVEGLPVFRYKDEDGSIAMKPCAEAWLGDRAAESLLERGLIPLLSIKGRDAVRLPRVVSISR